MNREGTGGQAGSGGTAGRGGTNGAGGNTLTGPCDIYQSSNTPCVAAHSTVRALYGAYSGNLYQVRRTSDNTMKDVGLLTPGGFANSATQDMFCAGTTCTISAIYDQSPRGNHLHVTPPGGWLPNGGKEANGGSSASGGSGNADGSGGSGNASGTGSGGNLGTGGSGDPDAGGSSGSSGTAGTGGVGEPGKTCLKGTGNYVMNGPYTVASKTVTIGSKGQFTIYYPNPLDAACPHPIVAWGNGTTITGGTAYDHFLKHAGSWGIVSIASHNSNVGDGTFHRAAIDYLLEQNQSSSSEFFGKLSTKAGVTGHSQGGAGADRASNHANVKANVNVQGSFGTPPPGTAAFLCLTGTEDIQPTGCPRAVMAATVPALSASWAGADHVSTTLLEGEGIE